MDADELLCQAGPGVSCGACCGLYNREDASPEALGALLARRTREFSRVPRQAAAILDYGETESDREAAPPPMPGFYRCPYLGLVGNPPDRPGCMLHPLAPGNAGRDFRDLCHWGGMACRMYTCPTHDLSSAHGKLLAAACGGWHLYGLVVPETAMIKAFFRLAGGPGPRAVLESPPALAALKRFFSYRVHWPFRNPDLPLGAYFFNDGLHPRPAVDYAALGRRPSTADVILRTLGSAFSSARELDRAEAQILDLAQRVGSASRP
ncbi:MAG: hypothetical protein JRI97_09315 [Deltaproteobacteria bacterium]|nr:hypothetical protein [Deltaproteobacteria bacterium]